MIFVAGSANLDFVVRSAHIPVPGETVLGRDFQTFPGGKGANQALACARAGGVETAMLLALGASVSVVGANGKRVIPLDKFFTLPADGNIRRENVLKNDEIITQIQVPASPVAARSTYLKFKERESMDFGPQSCKHRD